MKYKVSFEIERIEERILNACLRSGRKRDEISLMAVSKFHDLEKVEEAYNCGIRLFGESRVQEGTKKFAVFREKNRDSSVHFIGPLQRNKAKAAVSFFDCIQSIDSISLIDELGKLCASKEDPLPVFLEYHTGEESKIGFETLDDLFNGAERVISFPGLRLDGLMTVAPLTYDLKAIRSSFRSLKNAKDELEKRFKNISCLCLSMGMSSDFETAIEEGSTMIRIGSTIFGNSE